WASGAAGAALLAVLFASALVQPAVYSALVLLRHPEPGPTLLALVRLPFYAVWRVTLALRLLLFGRERRWIRTGRHPESPGTDPTVSGPDRPR
ncbi:MAG TPA: hypothetical protein VNH46_03360, partial [Gemmatimonadales bacterium]|nr:hypothetical protein [Gemmatimonadales bacterium]